MGIYPSGWKEDEQGLETLVVGDPQGELVRYTAEQVEAALKASNAPRTVTSFEDYVRPADPLRRIHSYDHKLIALDIIGATEVELVVRADGRVVWINTVDGCKLRICQVEGGNVKIRDERNR